MSRTPPVRSLTDPDPDQDVAAAAILAGAEEPADHVRLQLPLDSSYGFLVRLTVTALVDEAGLGVDHLDAVRADVTELFADLCRSAPEGEAGHLAFEVAPGAMRVATGRPDRAEPVAVRSWAPVPSG